MASPPARPIITGDVRLWDIEEKLVPLTERRWGAGAACRVELDRSAGMLCLHLPDGELLYGRAPEEGALLVSALALLTRRLERVDAWLAGGESGQGKGSSAL